MSYPAIDEQLSHLFEPKNLAVVVFPEDYMRRVYDRLICEKEFLLIPDATHLVMFDYADEVIQLVFARLKNVIER
jgi:pimeloyl-ACP methyl ester carboxylesterase